MKAETGPPPRLAETPGPAGDCVRAALARRDLAGEPPSLSALRERRGKRTQRQLALGSVAIAAAALLTVRLLHRDEEALSVRAETIEPIREELRVAPVEPERAAEVAPTSQPPLPPTGQSKAKPALPRAAPKPVLAPVEPAPRVASLPVVVDRARASGGARACAELARRGSAEEALSCYEGLASGTGMTAELALFERARLEGKALRRPDRALQTLEAYRVRFPNGSLRPEVMLARIDWLLRSGEQAQALHAVDEALASGLLRERTAELERLRDSLGAAPALDRAR